MTRTRGRVAMLAGACLAAAVASGARAACLEQDFDTVFIGYGDRSLFALVTGGDFETGAAGWTLSGGARVVAEGTNSLNYGPDAGASLPLGPGSAAPSPIVCITKDFRTMRMVTRLGVGVKARGELAPGVRYDNGTVVSTTRTAPAATWQPTAL